MNLVTITFVHIVPSNKYLKNVTFKTITDFITLNKTSKTKTVHCTILNFYSSTNIFCLDVCVFIHGLCLHTHTVSLILGISIKLARENTLYM